MYIEYKLVIVLYYKLKKNFQNKNKQKHINLTYSRNYNFIKKIKNKKR